MIHMLKHYTHLKHDIQKKTRTKEIVREMGTKRSM